MHNKMKTPKCFDTRLQYTEWQAMAKRAPVMGQSDFCIDCTPEYKALMVEQGRCEHPSVQFRQSSRKLMWGGKQCVEFNTYGARTRVNSKGQVVSESHRGKLAHG